MTQLIIPIELYEEYQSEQAHQEFEHVISCFGNAIQMEQDVAPNRQSIREDDYHSVSVELLRPDVRAWVEDQRIAVRFYMTCYLAPQHKAPFFCNADPDPHPGGRKVFFAAQAMARFEDKDGALLFKLTWGGQ